jgi:hypothetical protein
VNHTVVKRTAFFLVVLAVGLAPCDAQSRSTGGSVTRSRAEIEGLIEKVGRQAPDWWDSTPLTYPPTLDLDWPMRAEGPWDARKNVGQYIWDVINPNPGRWKEGIKLVNHLMIRHKDDPQKLVRAMETLGHMYHNLMEDWARAVFWWRLCERHGGYVDRVGLAHCYWKLGSKEMAVEVLAEVGSDYTRHGAVIKLWADMGEYDKALSLAERKAAEGMPVIAYLTAGDTCRLAGRYQEAAYYRSRWRPRATPGARGTSTRTRSGPRPASRRFGSSTRWTWRKSPMGCTGPTVLPTPDLCMSKSPSRAGGSKRCASRNTRRSSSTPPSQILRARL